MGPGRVSGLRGWAFGSVWGRLPFLQQQHFCLEFPALVGSFWTPVIWGVMTWRCPEPFSAHSYTLPSNLGPRMAQALGLPSPSPPLVVTCSDSASLFLSPQLWDIRRKGCVFRYRVRKTPSVGHHAGMEHGWVPGWQGQEGTAVQHG